MNALWFISCVVWICLVQAHVDYNFDSVWQNGTISSDIFNEVVVNEKNNDFYVVGTTGGSFTSTSNGGDDIIVGKFNVHNSPLWFVQLGTIGDDEGNSITIGRDTVYIAGSTEGTLSTFGETYAAGSDAFLAKINTTDGSLVWLTQWGTYFNDAANAVAYWEPNDTVVVAGFTESTPGNVDIFVAQYASNGSQTSYSQLVTSASIADIALGTDGSVYLCGAINGSFLFATKINSTGGAVWSRGSPDATGQLTSIEVDNTGQVWAVGITNAEWIEGIPLPDSYPYYSILILRFETVTGFPTFSLTLPANGSLDSGAYGLAIDNDQNLYVVGLTLGYEFLGAENPENGTSQAVLLKYNSESEEVEYVTLEGTSEADAAYSVAVSNNKIDDQPVWFVVGATNGSWGELAKGESDGFTLVGTAVPEKKTSYKLSTAAAAVIGVVIPVVLLTAAGVAIYIMRRKRHLYINQQWDMNPASTTTDLKDIHLSTFATTQSQFKIDYEDIEIGTEIGQGAFGVVYRGKWHNSSVAVKQFQQDRLQAKSLQDFLKEATNVSKLRSHRNVCQVYGVCVDPSRPLCIVMEYVPDNLQDLIYNKKIPVDVVAVLSLAKQIASGMYHIHQENILHCDLACRNLLVQSKGNNKFVVKITDFGLARVVENDQYNVTSQSSFPVRWSAPEVLTQHKISKASDVWSFGVVIWEMAEGVLPYYELSTNSEVVSYVCQQNKRLAHPTKVNLPDELLQVMMDCWLTEPADRPSFENIHKRLSDLKNLLVPSNRGSSLLVGNPMDRTSKEVYNNMVPNVNYNNVIADTNCRTDNYNNLDP